jgi:hypothetical protein
MVRDDEGYCSWVAGSEGLTGNLLEFQTFLRSRGVGGKPANKRPAVASPPRGGGGAGGGGGGDEGGTVSSGKHQGKTFGELLRSDRGYCEWVAGLEEVKAPWMKELREYCLSHGVKPQAPRKY